MNAYTAVHTQSTMEEIRRRRVIRAFPGDSLGGGRGDTQRGGLGKGPASSPAWRAAASRRRRGRVRLGRRLEYSNKTLHAGLDFTIVY
jgi:hypothetical protein